MELGIGREDLTAMASETLYSRPPLIAGFGVQDKADA